MLNANTGWSRYRQWKHLFVPVALFTAYAWLRFEPELSGKWKAGLVLAGAMGVLYLAEELVWMARNQGRPCEQCGQKIRPKPFSIGIRCSHCGHRE